MSFSLKSFGFRFWKFGALAFLFFGIWGLGFGSAYALTFDELLSHSGISAPTPAVLSASFNPPLLSAKSAVVLDQVSGEVLYESGGNLTRVPASLVKLTAALTALDTVPDWNATCRIESSDRVGGVQLAFGVGYSYRLSDLLQAVLIPSYNDATQALARCSGVGRDQFVLRMNEKVKQFGAWQTGFVEVSGISAQNFTTALDMAKIANPAFSTERLRNILAKPKVTICSVAPTRKCQTIKNTNELLGVQSSVVVGKTGFLEEAGYNFASSAKVGERYYITVVLGSLSKSGRFSDTQKLLAGIGPSFAFGKVAGAVNP